MARSFTIASDETLKAMISSAKERLVLVAPALSREVASFLADRIDKDDGPRVLSVILDPDPEVCRLGFGDIEVFDLLRPALEKRGLAIHTQSGIRIGLVVSDAEVLVYAPTPKLIEGGSNSEEKPNAIRIMEDAADDLSLACGVNVQNAVLTSEIGVGIASDHLIDEAKRDLKENPPRRFDLARVERVFNYKLEFVEFSVESYQLKTRSVPLPAALLGLGDANLQSRIRNSFRVFETGSPFQFEMTDPDDVRKKLNVTEKWLGDEAARLRKEYFIPLGSGSYGSLILKRHKPEFEAKVTRLKSLVASYATEVRSNIAEKVLSTRNDLIEALYPRLKAAPPATWSKRSVDGKLSDGALKQRLEGEVDEAFLAVEKSFNPTVVCLFKGVNYETITADDHFRGRIQNYFGKDEAAKLFSEYDAAPAKEQSS